MCTTIQEVVTVVQTVVLVATLLALIIQVQKQTEVMHHEALSKMQLRLWVFGTHDDRAKRARGNVRSDCSLASADCSALASLLCERARRVQLHRVDL